MKNRLSYNKLVVYDNVFLFSFLLIPAQIFRVFFVMGLKNEPLIAVGIILGIGINLHPILKLNKIKKIYCFQIFPTITAILCSLAGLLALFSFDHNNMPTMLVLSLILIASYYTAQFDLNLISKSTPSEKLRFKNKNEEKTRKVNWAKLLYPIYIFLIICIGGVNSMIQCLNGH